MLRNLYQHRRLILDFAGRELKTRYTGSVAGFAWHVLNPILLLAIYTLVFSQLMAARVPGIESTVGYTIYLCSGLLPWLAFQEAINRSTGSFVENANLIKKIYIPEEVFVANVVVSSSLNLVTHFAVFLAFLFAVRFIPGPSTLFLIPLFAGQQIFAFGIGIVLACGNLFFRDVSHIVGMALQAWFWITPIVYLSDIVPLGFRPWLEINPLYHLITAYHRVVITNAAPTLRQGTVVAAAAGISVGFSALVLAKLRTDIRDEV